MLGSRSRPGSQHFREKPGFRKPKPRPKPASNPTLVASSEDVTPRVANAKTIHQHHLRRSRLTKRSYLNPPVFLFIQVGSISSYILDQFEFYLDCELSNYLCYLPFERDDLRWISMALCRLLRPMGGHLRRRCWHESCLCRPERAAIGTLSQAHLGEPSVGRLTGNSGSFRMPFSARAYDRQQYSFSQVHCTICSFPRILRRLRGPSVDLRVPYRGERGCLAYGVTWRTHISDSWQP